MIASSITGNAGGSGQLFDLLTVVANPQEYQAKIKALEDATAEHKKFVDLVGPAADILSLKEKAQDELASAKAALAEAKQKAADTAAAAQAKAAEVLAGAQAQADALKQAAQAELDEAKASNAEAKSAARAAKQSQKQADEATAIAEAKAVELNGLVTAAQAAKAEAEAVRADILAKHQAFIGSL